MNLYSVTTKKSAKFEGSQSWNKYLTHIKI